MYSRANNMLESQQLSRLVEELRLRERELQLLSDTADEVSRQLHLDQLLPLVAERAVQSSECGCCDQDYTLFR